MEGGVHLNMNADLASPKIPLFTHFARVAKTPASPVRLELLEVLVQGEHRVDEMAPAGGTPMALEAGYPEWKAARLPIAPATRR